MTKKRLLWRWCLRCRRKVRAPWFASIDGKLVREQKRRTSPMQMTEGQDAIPVAMVLKVLDRCRHFEARCAELEQKNANLHGELETLRLGRQTVTLEEKPKRKGQ